MQRISSKYELHQNRRGIAVLWLVIWGSMFLTFFCVVLEIATLWQAHVEVKNSLDAAALAAVKEWRARGFVNPTVIPRNSGVAYAGANPVLGNNVTLDPNYTVETPANPNGNDSPTGEIVFGGLDGLTAPITFDPNANISLGFTFIPIPAVRVQKTIPVQGFCSSLFGFSPFNVTASSVAAISSLALPLPPLDQPRLVSVP